MIMKTLCNLEGSVKSSSVSKKYHKDSKQSCIGNPYTCQSIYVMNNYLLCTIQKFTVYLAPVNSFKKFLSILRRCLF